MRHGFQTPLRVELRNPTSNGGGGTWVTLTPLLYISQDGTEHVVPEGFETDFASVPRLPLAYMFFGCTAHQASVLHDYYCVTGKISRVEADKLFLEAMRSAGLKIWRTVPMFVAVRMYYEITTNFLRRILPW